jgi:hypothetical protein
MRRFLFLLATGCLMLLHATASDAAQPVRHGLFEVSVSDTLHLEPLDGRVLLILSTDPAKEPRELIREDLKSQQIFGVDAEGLRPGAAVSFEAGVLGFPCTSLAAIPAGDYTVQAVLHRYETFRRAGPGGGYVLKLPMDRGEGQHWNIAPGNLYSTPAKIHFDPHATKPINVVLDKQIPPIEPPKDTKFIKHITIESKLLSE